VLVSSNWHFVAAPAQQHLLTYHVYHLPLSGRSSSSVHFGGATSAGYFKSADAILPEDSFRFATVTDMDQLSKVADAKKPTFRSILLPGIIRRDNTSKYTIQFDPTRTLFSR